MNISKRSQKEINAAIETLKYLLTNHKETDGICAIFSNKMGLKRNKLNGDEYLKFETDIGYYVSPRIWLKKIRRKASDGFFIPAPKSFLPGVNYRVRVHDAYFQLSRWEGEYGNLRRNFCKWAIEELEKHVTYTIVGDD